MGIPETLDQVLIVVALLVPGFSFVTIRTWYVGWRSPSYGPTSRLLEAVYVSAIFLVVYACLATLIFSISALWTQQGSLRAVQLLIEEGWKGAPAWLVAVLGFLLLVGLPGLVAVLLNHWAKVTIVDDDGKAKAVRKPVNRNQSMPRAWDHAAFAEESRFVRVKTATGVYIGGYLDPGGYVSTYPYDRDIYISHQWRMSKTGAFKEPIADSLGVWVPINDDCIVDWIKDPRLATTARKEEECLTTGTELADSPTEALPDGLRKARSRSRMPGGARLSPSSHPRSVRPDRQETPAHPTTNNDVS